MSLGPSGTPTELELELAEDSVSAVTYESDTETQQTKRTSRKPPKSPKSPYTSSTCLRPKTAAFLRSLRGTESKHFDGSLVRASRHLCRGSLKQGTWVGQTKSDLDLGHASSTLSSSTPEYLKEALGMKKPKHSRCATNGYMPGTPCYKEKEDMYDEIIELKKAIQSQKCEGDKMKTKLRRLEEENNRKDKQIEQLLDPSRTFEFAWTRAEQKNDAGWMINGLKQKILRLEQQCKEKDNIINKLQTDAKATNAEEMRITLDTYYEEIQRLRALLAKSKTVGRKSLPEAKQQKVLNVAVLQLSRSIQELQAENRHLKSDLDHALNNSPVYSPGKDYAEWSRQRLVRRISKLEKKMDEMGSSRLPLSERSPSPLLSPSPSSTQLPQSVAKESEECERLRRLAKKLRGQQAVLQNQLAVKEEEIQKLMGKVEEVEAKQNVHYGPAGRDATQPPDQNHLALHLGKPPSYPVFVSKPKGSHSRPSLPCTPEFVRKEQAARIIQRQWKAYKAKTRDVPCGPGSLEMAADCKVDDKTVQLIQSVFRAHAARADLKERPFASSPANEAARPAPYSGEKKPVWSPFKPSPLVFTSVPSATAAIRHQLESPSADEALSDDSDDIITVSPFLVKPKPLLDFSSRLPHSLLHS